MTEAASDLGEQHHALVPTSAFSILRIAVFIRVPKLRVGVSQEHL